MELVPIIYKFVLFVGGFVLVVLFGFYLASRMQKKKTEEHVSVKRGEVKIRQRQTEYAHLKNQLHTSKTDTEYRGTGSKEPEIDKRIRNSKSEKPSGESISLKEKRLEESKERFSVLNEKINLDENSKNSSEVENEFRFFYQQNYSKTV